MAQTAFTFRQIALIFPGGTTAYVRSLLRGLIMVPMPAPNSADVLRIYASVWSRKAGSIPSNRISLATISAS